MAEYVFDWKESVVLWETVSTKICRLLVKLLGGGRCLKENLLRVTYDPSLDPQYKQNVICRYGEVNSSSYVTTILMAFPLNPSA